MLSRLVNFFKTGPDAPLADLSPEELDRAYKIRRWRVFIGITVGYGFFYVTRLTLSVVKKPILDSGLLTATELGVIGSALFFSYAFGKLCNGVLSDYANIRRFMSAGLIISALVNLAFGATSMFWIFLALWALNGWVQSMGSAPSVVTLSQWFASKERGTLYGIWYVSHSIGEGITFVGTAVVVSYFGWRAGFGVAGLLALAVGILLIFMLSDRPRALGLPSIAEYKNDPLAATPRSAADDTPLVKTQLKILKFPAVWILGLASALTYVSRYAINNWGILYLQEVKGYTLAQAGPIMGTAPIVGVVGGALSGIISDRLFASNRHKATLLYGTLQIIGLALFFYGPAGHVWLDYAGMAIFGFAVAGTVAFLGGLTAIDLTPRQVTGAVMGFIGLFSYMGAALQDVVSGWLIDAGKTVVDGETHYNFDAAVLFWFGAAVLSLIVAMTVWKVKPRTEL